MPKISVWEGVIRQGFSQYKKISDGGISARETERAAFGAVTSALEVETEGAGRLRALGRNHALWSILVRDMSLGDNGLPEDLKQNLIALGVWSMRYSTLAILKNLPVAPLIAVNRNMQDGLGAQAEGKVHRDAAIFGAPIAV